MMERMKDNGTQKRHNDHATGALAHVIKSDIQREKSVIIPSADNYPQLPRTVITRNNFKVIPL